MLLDRLRIHGKLALLVIIPLLGVAGLAVPVVAERVTQARRAASTADRVQLAGEVGSLIQNLQQERLLSIGYLLGVVDRGPLVQQAATVTDRIADLRSDYGTELPGPVRSAVTGIQDLAGVRNGILSRQARPDRVMAAFSAVHKSLIDSLRLVEGIDTASPEGRQIIALDAVLRTDEHISAGSALMVLVVSTRSAAVVTQHAANLAALQVSIDRFMAFATGEQQRLYTLVGNAVNSRIGPDFVERVMADPTTSIADLSVDALFPAVSSLSTLGQFVEKKIVTDVVADITNEQRRALTTAYVVGALVLLILVVVVLLSVAVARTVARPLTRLTQSADRVARVTEAELVRVADDESESIDPIRLDPVDIGGRDEIGELARAFDRVQITAARLVERQAASRRNVAQMFGHVGRRTQNLVGRQIALIDRLEHQETDPTRLQHLYRLDHVSSRLRRNAGSLVVLSGSGSGDGHTVPMPLGDVVRLALGEIEDYTRVDVQIRLDVGVAPGVIGDLVLALAELMENGTSFSPPHTRVTVSAEFTDRGVRISLVDRGIGMPAERMAEENARFTRRERLDLAPSEVLGLFVVGRLARRHDWRVVLTPTPGGGVTVALELDDRLLVHHGSRAESPVVARASVVPPPADPGRPDQPQPWAARPEARPDQPATRSGRPVTEPLPRRRTTEPEQEPAPAARSATVPPSADPGELPGAGEPTGPAAPARPRGVPSGMPSGRPSRVPSGVPSGRPSGVPSTVESGTRSTVAGRAVAPVSPAAGLTVPPAGTVPLTGGVPANPAASTRAVASAPGLPRIPDLSPVFDPAALTRATRSLESGQPWDAFRTRRDEAGTLGGGTTGESGSAGLRQRVPGAQLPASGGTRRGGAPTPADPAVVRALIEEFEAGVRRAQRQHSDAVPVSPAAETMLDTAVAHPDPTVTRLDPTVAELRATSATSATSAAPVEPPRRLSRRVPGANLSVPLPGPPVLGDGPGDPDEVRDLINQFESGVARALSEVDLDHRHQEGPT